MESKEPEGKVVPLLDPVDTKGSREWMILPVVQVSCLYFEVPTSGGRFIYTGCYCEENVWKLFEDPVLRSRIDNCFVVFISSPGDRVIY